MARTLVDTNILVYAFSGEVRQAQAAQFLQSEGLVLSVQALNEFARVPRVARAKLKLAWEDIEVALGRAVWLAKALVPVGLGEHRLALGLAQGYKPMVAAGPTAGCTTMWSQDMHNGLLIEGQLRIVNRFLAS